MEKSTYKCGVLPQLSFCPSWWLWWSWWSYSPGQMAPSMHWGAAKPSCTSSQQDRTSGRLSLYHGTPRTLLHLLPKDPSKQAVGCLGLRHAYVPHYVLIITQTSPLFCDEGNGV
ncbi:uncharacterized protein ACWYII_018338 isoform 2-T2 [Salvelinus alpinus]